MIGKILVPTDGSATARKAALYAMDLAKATGAGIVLLTVLDRGPFAGATVSSTESPTHLVEPLADFLRQAAEKALGELEKTAAGKGVQAGKSIRWGHPVEEILKEAEASRSDLIVIGSHGRSALEAALLGSVAFGVIHKDTKIPVLVVRK